MPTAQSVDHQQAPRRKEEWESGERGAAAPLELVLVTPVLILLVLFVLWAGRGSRAGLVADLAAEEAAVVASLCCGNESGPAAAAERETVVRQVLSARPGLDFLCIGGPQPRALEGGDRFVDEKWLGAFEQESRDATQGVGVIGVRFECETDGAVAPLAGLFPTVGFYGQAAEVIAIPPRPLLSVTDADTDEDTGRLEFRITLSAPSAQDMTVHYKTETGGGDHKAIAGDDYTPVDDSLQIPARKLSDLIEVEIAPDSDLEEPETFLLDLRLEPSNPCAYDAPALADPIESDEIKIQCDDPDDASTYQMPVDPSSNPLELKLDYWKIQVTGTINNDDL